MRYSTLIVPIALLAIPATANAAGCQPAFVGADQTVLVDGVDIGSLNSAVRDFSVRVQNKAGPSGQPGAMAAAPSGAPIRIARVGELPTPDSQLGRAHLRHHVTHSQLATPLLRA